MEQVKRKLCNSKYIDDVEELVEHAKKHYSIKGLTQEERDVLKHKHEHEDD